MSSLFNHLFISLALLLLFSKKFGLNPRNIFVLAIFGILPDADVFLLHRASLHNVFVVLIPLFFFAFLKSRREIPGIICFYLASHIILDIFDGGTFIFYPIYKNVFFVQAEIAFRHNIFLPALKFGFSQKIMNSGTGEPVISSENMGVGLILFLSMAISVLQKKQ